MSKATIEAYRKQRAEQIEIDRPTAYLGIHCRDCVIAWIVCELPQQMKYLMLGMITEAGQQLDGPDLESWMAEIGA